MADRDLSGRMLGEFVLLERIGQGSHGAVYRAAQPMLERHVAVKVLRNNGGSSSPSSSASPTPCKPHTSTGSSTAI